MTAKLLHVSPELGLPLEVLSDSTAIVGRKRTGKSNTAAVMVEEAIDAGAQVVIFDPKGDWWGLRSTADGERAGYPVVVIGGSHAMLPLNHLAGVAVADWIIDSGYSVVLDISEIETNAETDRFVSDLLKQLRKRKKAKPGAIVIVIDEADELAPQDTRFGSAFLKTLGLVVWMVKRGGFLGIGTIVVTQRPASLSKNVLTQTELLVALQTMGEQDIDAIDGWFKHHVSKDERAEILANIAKLDKGEGYVLSGQILKGVFRVHFRRRGTFDSGATPAMGEIVAQPKVVADVDLAKLSDAMAAAVEEAKATDPEILRSQVRELEKQLAEGKTGTRPATLTVEIPVLGDGALDDLKRVSEQWLATGRLMLEAEVMARDRAELLRSNAAALAVVLSPVAKQLDLITSVSTELSSPGGAAGKRSKVHTTSVRAVAEVARPSEAIPARKSRDEVARATDDRRLVNAIALLEVRAATPSVEAIAAVSRLKATGGYFRSQLKRLRTTGAVDEANRLTDTGRALTTDVVAGLSEIELRYVDVVAELEARGIEPKPVTVAAWLGFDASGGHFRGLLKRARLTGLAEGDGRLTKAGHRFVKKPARDRDSILERLDPTPRKLLEIAIAARGPVKLADAAAKLSLSPAGGYFRSSVARLADMGLIASRREIAPSEAMRQAAAT